MDNGTLKLVGEIKGCFSELLMLRSGVDGVDKWMNKITAIDTAFKNVSILEADKKEELIAKINELGPFCDVFGLLQPSVQSLCFELKFVGEGKLLEGNAWKNVIDAMHMLYVNSKFVFDRLIRSEVVARDFCEVFVKVFKMDYKKTKDEFKDESSRKRFILDKLVATGEAMADFSRTLYHYNDDAYEPLENLHAEIDQIASALNRPMD